ncbi:hypothetical protein ACFFSA_23705 [Nonomuraea helvata]|uniref:Transposase n=1 Tax=Nonomuraea helvata TaxID=37484 RepID=A0ABV5S357_9ACTN
MAESFQAAKSQVGLDHYQVRGWTAWHRHVTLAMIALALLTVIAAAQPTSTADDRIPLTLPEIRRLLATLVLTTAHPVMAIMRWSDWRRRQQARARTTASADPNHDREVSLEY